MTDRTQEISGLIVLSVLLVGVMGCARPATPAPVVPTPTVAAGWERFINPGPCGYVIDYPSGMDLASQGTYSWILNHTTTELDGPFPNFLYISVIPDDFPRSGGEPGVIYNYDPAEMQTLLNLQVGESRSLREDPFLADWFTYTRLPDAMLSNQPAQSYENTQPWEFPPGTKEIRYALKAEGCTYLIGGYLATVGSGQPGAINEERFNQIIATFRLTD